MTYAQVADDVLVAMGFTFDDAMRYREIVMYNITLLANKLGKQVLAKHYNVGDGRGASDMLSTRILPVSRIDVSDAVVDQWDATYFDLPRAVYGLAHDGGINFVRYLRNEIPPNCPPAVAQTPFTGTTLASLNAIYGSAYQRPRYDRPYYARAKARDGEEYKDRVYLFGLGSDVRHVLVGLYETQDFIDLDPDQPVNLPDEMLHTLKQMLMDMEGWTLSIPQERLVNDGTDDIPPVNLRSQRSINDVSQQDA